MTARRPRGVRPEEQALWDKVRQSTVPLHQPKKQILIDAIQSIAPEPPTFEIPAFRIGQTHAVPVTRKPVSSPPALQMDSKSFGRMKKGKITPEARIDLHGMTLAQAHPALIGFILNAHTNGCRLALVITGKGRITVDVGPIPVRKGVLKYQVPQWLRQAPIGGVVQQISDAHAKHGGDGALYVYLRRRR